MNKIIYTNSKEDEERKELHLHKHSYNINIQLFTKSKQLVLKNKTIQIKCIVCGCYIKTNKKKDFCSNTCYIKFQELKHKKYLYDKKKLDDATNKKHWWQ